MGGWWIVGVVVDSLFLKRCCSCRSLRSRIKPMIPCIVVLLSWWLISKGRARMTGIWMFGVVLAVRWESSIGWCYDSRCGVLDSVWYVTSVTCTFMFHVTLIRNRALSESWKSRTSRELKNPIETNDNAHKIQNEWMFRSKSANLANKGYVPNVLLIACADQTTTKPPWSISHCCSCYGSRATRPMGKICWISSGTLFNT